MPLLLCCGPILKESGSIVTNSFLSAAYSKSIEEYISKSVAIPLTLLPSVLGLRCAGFEGSLASESSNYSHNPPATANFIGIRTSHLKSVSLTLVAAISQSNTGRQSRILTWFKQPCNSMPNGALSSSMVDALCACAKLCILHYKLAGFNMTYLRHRRNSETKFGRIKYTQYRNICASAT